MRIKLSQSDWQRIGEKMGWLKAASGAGIHPSGPWSGISASQGGMEEAGTPASDEDKNIMGEIIDHNARVKARLGDGGKPDPSDRDAAQKIVSEAKSHGHEGLAVNSEGMIVKTTVVDDWLGRTGPDIEEPISENTKPHKNNKWTGTVSNYPGIQYGVRPF